MAPILVRRTMRGVMLLALLAAPAMTEARNAAPDFMPHPLPEDEPLPASGPHAFISERVEFVRQIAESAQKLGFHVVEQRVVYCPRPASLGKDFGYPPWQAVVDSTSGALYERFGKNFDIIKSGDDLGSVLFQIHTPTPGYVLLTGYPLPLQVGGSLIAYTVIAKN